MSCDLLSEHDWLRGWDASQQLKMSKEKKKISPELKVQTQKFSPKLCSCAFNISREKKIAI